MARRVEDVSPDEVTGLPFPCAACVFWEVATAPQGPVEASPGELEETTSAKQAWWQATQLEWGAAGKVVRIDDAPVAFVAYAPARNYPRIRRLRAAPSEDSLLLTSLWVAPDHRGQGLGKLLVTTALREAVRRRTRALEAYGSRGASPLAQSCFAPEAFLLAVGFEVRHDDLVHPLFRLDVRKTVRWQESFGHALAGVRSALGRRERVPAPARPALEAQRSR